MLPCPKPELCCPNLQPESTPRLRRACHQSIKVCLRNKLDQTWTSFLKTWVCFLIPKGNHGTVTMEKISNLLDQGMEVTWVLRSDLTPLLWYSCSKMHNLNQQSQTEGHVFKSTGLVYLKNIDVPNDIKKLRKCSRLKKLKRLTVTTKCHVGSWTWIKAYMGNKQTNKQTLP